MTDQTTPQDAASVPPSQVEQGATSNPQDIAAQLERALKELSEVRKEAAGYRVKARETEEKRMLEQGKFEELYKQTAAELEQYKPFKERFESVASQVAESNAKRVEQLPEHLRRLAPKYDDPFAMREWLDAAASTALPPTPPRTDAGQRGDTPPAPASAEAQRAASVAAQFGYSVDPAKVAARKRELEEQRNRMRSGKQEE